MINHQKHRDRVYLSKQNEGSQGSGIVLLTNPNHLVIGNDDLIVQEYIQNPFLLRGLKHDMRLYVTITSVEPLVAYINREGLVRFCTEKYQTPTTENRIKSNMHLSNYSLNKNSKEYVFTDSIEGENDGSKQTFSSYSRYLPQPEKVFEDIKELIQMSLKALQPFLRYFLRCRYPKRDHGRMFHIIGYDIMLDSDYKPFILELNANPSLNVQFEGNDEVKEKAGISQKQKPNESKENDKNNKKTYQSKDSNTPQPKISFGYREPHNPKERSASLQRSKESKKSEVPKFLPMPSMIQEDYDNEEDEMKEQELTEDQRRLKNYIKFRDAQIEKNKMRKSKIEVDPICLVDLHVKSL